MSKTNGIFNVAVIGCGRISIRHLSSLQELKGMVKLVAVCDNKKEKADICASEYKVKSYYDYKVLIDNEELDAVHICLPHYLHTAVAEYAMEKGVAVLCEKPMSIDYNSAKHAVELSKKNNVQYGIVFQCRYNNSAQLVKKALGSGQLGKIISVRSILTWSRPDSYYLKSDWKGTWDKEGGGVVIDQAIHSIDLVNWLVDSEVDTIQCSMYNRGHKSVKVEDTAEGLITYKNGVKYAFYAMNNYAINEPIEIKMVCEKGQVTFGYNDAYILYNDGKLEEAHQEDAKLGKDGKEYWGYQHIRQIEQFYKALSGKEKLDISGEEALKTHKLIMDIYKKAGKENENRCDS